MYVVDITLDSVVQTSLAIALALLPVFALYLVNEWTNRRQFEREKKFDRKREGYEKALAAVRRTWDATLLMRSLNEPLETPWGGSMSDPKLLKGLDAESAKELQYLLMSFVKLLSSSLAITVFTDDLPQPGLFGEGVDKSNIADVTQKLGGKASGILIRVINRASDELEAALSSLTLMDAPASVLSDLRALHQPLSLGADVWEDPTTWRDDKLKAIEAAMKKDLQDTIAKHGLRRWIPDRSQRAVQKT